MTTKTDQGHHRHRRAPRDDVTLDELVDSLRHDGVRITTARRAVLEEFLRSRDEHPTAEELTERIHDRYPDIHLSTVYRNLAQLEEIGVLAQVRVGDGPASYHLSRDVHDHAVCRRCGTLLELPPEIMSTLAELLDAECGFALAPSHVTLRGECRSCRRRRG
jgi:Fe2+ or Zn2+ uptake regulation protein